MGNSVQSKCKRVCFYLDIKFNGPSDQRKLEKLTIFRKTGHGDDFKPFSVVFFGGDKYKISYTDKNEQGTLDAVWKHLQTFLGSDYKSIFQTSDVYINERLKENLKDLLVMHKHDLFEFLVKVLRSIPEFQRNLPPRFGQYATISSLHSLASKGPEIASSTKMDAYEKGRGLVILCSNETFHKEADLSKRKGAKADVKNLKKLFAGHKFISLNNFSLPNLQSLIEMKVKTELAKTEMAYKFIVFYLGSHGGEQSVKMCFDPPTALPSGTRHTTPFPAGQRDITLSVNFASDVNGTKIFPKEDIFNKFSEMDFKGYLEGIPMLFLMAFCRGGEHNYAEDGAEKFNTQVEEQSARTDYAKLPKINKADKLIYFSTVEGYYSYRSEVDGTILIQEFMKCTEDNKNECFSNILSMTNEAIAGSGEKKLLNVTHKGRKVYQMPLIRHTLRKRFLYTSPEDLKDMGLYLEEEKEPKQGDSSSESNNSSSTGSLE